MVKWIKWSASGRNSRRQTQHTHVDPCVNTNTHTCTQMKTGIETWRQGARTRSIKAEEEDRRKSQQEAICDRMSVLVDLGSHMHIQTHTHAHVYGNSASLRVFINACGLYAGATGNGAIWFSLSSSSASVY